MKLMGKPERIRNIAIAAHIDHGKTALLKKIREEGGIALDPRKALAEDDEFGDITQHIKAFQIQKPQTITFIDTPGHQAFQAMRQKGSKGADVAILVVAADDGVKKQTIEAYETAIKNKIPVVIAVNKIDKAQASGEKTKNELQNLIQDELVAEVSATTGQGVKELIEGVLMEVAELNLSFDKNQPSPKLDILEEHIDDQAGQSFDIILRNGSLKVGDIIPLYEGRVKSIKDIIYEIQKK